MQANKHDTTEEQVAANIALIESFYGALKNRDHITMAQCYHPDARFKDAVFELDSKQVCAMWHMLLSRGKDLELNYSVKLKNGKVTAHWEAKYTFSQTGRKVHNIVNAEFEFKDGKIIRHTDSFNFWRWSKQALGLVGALFGWSHFLQNKVSTMAGKTLNNFIAKHTQYK